MFLLVSGRHVGTHTDGHQHGVSIQISINLSNKFLRISCIRKIAVTRILARFFAYLPSFLIYFEWRGTENQQLNDPSNNTRPTTDLESNFSGCEFVLHRHLGVSISFSRQRKSRPRFVKSRIYRSLLLENSTGITLTLAAGPNVEPLSRTIKHCDPRMDDIFS